MPLSDDGKRWISNPATKYNPGRDRHLLQEVEAGKYKPDRKSSKTRTTQDIPLLPKHLPPTDKEALQRLRDEYRGKKKPALVLRFVQNGSGYRVNLGNVEVHVHSLIDGSYRAFLVQKALKKNDAGKIYEFWRQLLSGYADVNFGQAVKNLTTREGWFYNGAEWRSLEWVFKSVVVVFQGKGLLPKEYVVGVKEGKNLHVSGHWRWQSRDALRVSPKLHKALRRNSPAMHRTPSSPDLRNDMSFDPEEKGKLTKSRKSGAYRTETPNLGIQAAIAPADPKSVKINDGWIYVEESAGKGYWLKEEKACITTE